MSESLVGAPGTEPADQIQGDRWDLRRLMRPASIAVVGATDRSGSYAAQTLQNLELIAYPGEVWGVNPKRDEVLGRPCVPTIDELPVAVDAVVVAIPAAGVPDVIEQAGARGCGGAVVFGAGFGEVEAGWALQQELIASARRHRMPVCGPNCDGIVVVGRRVALWGDALLDREPGRVALVSQSGNVAVNALTSSRGLRFHTVVSSGNQAVLGADSYLRFLAEEEDVGAVALYLEDDVGPDLCEGLAACAERGIRVAVLKVGTSTVGAQAAAAHSAALAGDQRIFRSLIEEAGAEWAEDVHELLELAKTLAVPVRRRQAGGTLTGGLAIMTCSGGDSAQGADECARLGIPLPGLNPATRARLEELLPSAATAANPLDYTALLWGEKDALAELIRALGEDTAIEQVLVFYDQLPGIEGPSEESWRAVREAIVEGAHRSPAATIVSSTLPELLDDRAAWHFAEVGVPAAAGLRTGLRCVAAMRRPPGDPARLRGIAAQARAVWRARHHPPPENKNENDSHSHSHSHFVGWLGEHESKELLRSAGLPVVEGRLVSSEEDAAEALAELGGAVALKLNAPSVLHKSELGALELDVRSVDHARRAYRRLASLAAQHGGAVLAERMVPPGLEVLVAARTSAIVPALVVGLGGTAAELLDAVAIIPLPAGADRIERSLRAAHFAPLLTGLRGAAGIDLGAVARLAEQAGKLLLEAGLAEIELNPVIVDAAGAVAVDSLVRVRR